MVFILFFILTHSRHTTLTRICHYSTFLSSFFWVIIIRTLIRSYHFLSSSLFSMAILLLFRPCPLLGFILHGLQAIDGFRWTWWGVSSSFHFLHVTFIVFPSWKFPPWGLHSLHWMITTVLVFHGDLHFLPWFCPICDLLFQSFLLQRTVWWVFPLHLILSWVFQGVSPLHFSVFIHGCYATFPLVSLSTSSRVDYGPILHW